MLVRKNNAALRCGVVQDRDLQQNDVQTMGAMRSVLHSSSDMMVYESISTSGKVWQGCSRNRELWLHLCSSIVLISNVEDD